ncbi:MULTISPECIES: hypothetical protein [Corynebacterium]|uniref:Uncharacterized protein n=1 Tax=Corynebacterium striatum TaxID=43770 RepID=A0ABC8CJV4_CORST|nr:MULTISPECIES: hypothetical protein [Corynebacterium]ATZ08389.1 hypothetical protein A9D01_06045 [Corynebacterium striatum]EGT5613196.1 hypothetical protein [Corynebacterium striatum]KAA1262975.1 hypothetical protein D7S42_11680 [Corynebacterium striatum]MDK8808639.1 hypothetical protein [Corynebacterium striatum]MDK8825873.1 hypothetical protein [Corynebacterium striatum]
MDGDVTALLVCAGLVLVMVLYWAYYIRCVRRQPKSEERYDDVDLVGAESDGVLFIYPYCSLNMGAGGAMGLVASANPREFVYTVLKVPLVAAFVIGVIGFTSAVGVPLSWPFVPRWAVDIRKAKRARRRERRQARKREKEE